jgi:hypothetical protein
MFSDQEGGIIEADQHLLRDQVRYAIWVDKAHLSDREMRDYLMVTFIRNAIRPSRHQLHKDVAGQCDNASKEFFRYKAIT